MHHFSPAAHFPGGGRGTELVVVSQWWGEWFLSARCQQTAVYYGQGMEASAWVPALSENTTVTLLTVLAFHSHEDPEVRSEEVTLFL